MCETKQAFHSLIPPRASVSPSGLTSPGSSSCREPFCIFSKPRARTQRASPPATRLRAEYSAELPASAVHVTWTQYCMLQILFSKYYTGTVALGTCVCLAKCLPDTTNYLSLPDVHACVCAVGATMTTIVYTNIGYHDDELKLYYL